MTNLGSLPLENVKCSFAVAGAGMAGTLAALAAARRGVDTILISDRPVIGGNASKEVRVWVNGADGGANNRYHRETGLMEEIKLENLHRNPEGNAETWDILLMDMVLGQPHLRVFFNTTVCAAGKSGGRLAWAEAVQLGSERRIRFHAKYFADCTGDGTLGALAGAKWMRYVEARSEFGEKRAPARREKRTMGATILYVATDAGKPVRYVAPKWPHRLSARDFKWRGLPDARGTAQIWWAEYGGTMDTIRENEEIRLENLRITTGIWGFVKTSPLYRGKADNLRLEWIGTIPGKRESRRLVGDHVLTEHDVVERPPLRDAVAYGGWSMDDHPGKGFYDSKSPSSHFYLPGIYNIPLRSLYSRHVPNLFMSGRNASLTHQALCTTRVMATCGQMGEAVGAAVALALRTGAGPREIANGPLIHELQQDLLRTDHHIRGVRNMDSRDMARTARISASSSACSELPPQGGTVAARRDRALMFPVAGGRLDSIRVWARIHRPGTVKYVLYRGDARGDFLPGPAIKAGTAPTGARGRRAIDLPLDVSVHPGFLWLELKANRGVDWLTTEEKRPGVATFVRGEQVGTDYRWWNEFTPWGWPEHFNLAYSLAPRQPAYGPESVANGFSRPFLNPNIWISGPGLPQHIDLAWDRTRRVSTVQLRFDSDLERHYENLWDSQDFNAMPTLVRDYRVQIRARSGWKTVASVRDNHQRLREHPIGSKTDAIRIVVTATNGVKRAHIYEVRVY